MRLIVLLTLLTGCAKPDLSIHKPESHSCPKAGHGPCYLCDAPKFVKR